MSSARTSPSVGRTSPRTRRLLHRAGELQPSLLQPLEPRTLLAVTPVGPEFVVEGGGPFYHDVAMNDAGDHVVVWNLFNFQQIVQARRYGADGTPKGDPFYVPLSATEHVVAPSVALDDAGNFIVVAGDRDVLAHRYDAAGNPLGQAFRVNTHAGGFHTSPSVAMDDAGNFVVVWSSSQQDGDGNGSGIYAQRFGADGTPRGGEFRVPDSIAGNQLSPAVAIDDTGAFTIAWVSDVDGSYSSLKVVARRFDPDGAPLTGDLLLSSPVNNSDDYHLDLDVNAHGHAVVTWTSQIVESAPEYILARRLDPAGAFVGDVITVADDADGQRQSTVAIDDAGNFLITWGGFDALPEPGTYGEVVYDENIYARHFAADGTPTAPEFRVNTNVDSVQQEPIVAGDANGDAIVVYMSFAQTGIGSGILAQRYQPLTEPPASVTGSAWDDADADGLRDPGEPPLAGVLVNLYNEQGAIAGTTPTDAEGFYRFDVLQPGAQYFLDVHRPPGRVLTLANVGPDEVIDSDFDRNHRRSEPFTVAAGAPAPVFNAGFVRQSTVSGTVFHDRDDDGQRDAGEEPLSGWTVFLDDDADGQFDAGERAVVTGDGGAYSFDAITPGEIRVALQPQRHWTTRPENGVHVIPLGVGVDLTAIDFANHTDVPERHVLPRSDPYEVAPEPDGVGDSAVTIDSAGREIVVWARFNGTDGDVFIRRYAPDGSPLGEPYAVSTFIPMDQAQPDVAALPGGGFVVTFWGYTGDDPVGSFDPEETGIWFQRFGTDGMPVGELVRVDDIIARGDIRPALAVHPQSGRFAIAWQSTADGDDTVPIGMVRWYDAATGLPLSNPTALASGISRAENQPQPGFSSDGTLTVIWESNAVYFRRFDADMQPLGAEQPLPADPWETSFAIAPSGDFFIAWQEEIAVSVTRIVARRFAPDGTPIGEEFGVNLYDVSSGRNDYLPDVAASDDGFTVTWRRQTWTESTVYARRYSLAGVPLGGEFPIHDAALDGATPAVAMDDTGGFLVAFPALTVPEFTRGLFARRYLTSPNDAPAASDASANVTLSLDATGSEEKAPVIDLHSLFTDDQPNAALTYSIVRSSNPSLFTNYVFAPDGTLKLPLTAHLPGSSTVTVRATDAGGRFADVAFTVTVKPEIILSGDDTYTLGSYVELDLIRLSGNARLNIPQELMISFKTKALELSDNAILDIPSYGLIVEAAPETRDAVLAAAHNWLGTARNYNGGRWTGPGITSSYLRSDDVPPHTSLVAIINPGHLTDGNGVPLGPDAVVITYAYDGDANLDGKVNADDYFKIDSGFLDPPADPTYAQGDFNYDGKINADDYFLIDSAFLAQPPPPAAAAATPAPASPAAMSEEQTKTQRRRAVRPPVDLDPARRR